MNITSVIKTLLGAGAIAGFTMGSALAQDDAQSEDQAQQQENQTTQAADMDELLEMVREGTLTETELHRQREQEFIQQRDNQQQLLQEARQMRENEERRSERLEQTFQQNETTIAELQDRLQQRLGNLSELFGVLQQVAGDARGVFEGSLITIQFPNRNEKITELIEKASRGTNLPSIEEIEGLWFEMLREMNQSSKVVRFPHQVWTFDGQTLDTNIIRVGDFNVLADGKYFTYDPSNNRVVELARQPSGRFTGTIEDLMEAEPSEQVALGIDPSRGQLLSILVQAPSLGERIDQGREVGYIIIAMGIIGILFTIERFVYLSLVTNKIRKQIKDTENPQGNNPLGRVLQVYQQNKSVDVETLELKLDEAILKETPALERFLTIIKIISAVAPLFGLLGTVTGMIATFQAITLFGTGDPRLMADGISQALVTTVLGLTVAIPTLLLHSFVAGMSRRVIHILEEQSAGIIAMHAEKEASHGGAG